MDIKKLLFWGIILASGYYFLKSKGMLSKLSGCSPQLQSGLGVGGQPRAGNPKSEAERQTTHKARFGEDLPPDRGAGLKKGY